MNRIRLGWTLTKKSWSVLKADRSLALFPAVSGLAVLAAFALIWGPALGLGLVQFHETTSASGAHSASMSPLGYVAAVLTAYVCTAVAVFFNVALAGCAAQSMKGQDTSLRQGLQIAWSRIGQVLGWALLATTVNVILRALEERLPLAGRIAAMLAGAAWSLATMFVIPVIALEGAGPVHALKESAGTFRKRWGEGLTGNALIGLVATLAIMAILLVGVGAGVGLASVSVPAAIAAGAAAVAAALVVGVVMATLNQVFTTALFVYSTEGQAGGPFTEAEFAAAFKPAKGR